MTIDSRTKSVPDPHIRASQGSTHCARAPRPTSRLEAPLTSVGGLPVASLQLPSQQSWFMHGVTAEKRHVEINSGWCWSPMGKCCGWPAAHLAAVRAETRRDLGPASGHSARSSIAIRRSRWPPWALPLAQVGLQQLLPPWLRSPHACPGHESSCVCADSQRLCS